MITVIQVMQDMGVRITKHLSWRVGAAVRDEWLRQHGEPPVKRLRTKTNTKGSHCFAIYHEDFRPTIERIIRLHDPRTAPQLSFDWAVHAQEDSHG